MWVTYGHTGVMRAISSSHTADICVLYNSRYMSLPKSSQNATFHSLVGIGKKSHFGCLYDDSETNLLKGKVALISFDKANCSCVDIITNMNSMHAEGVILASYQYLANPCPNITKKDNMTIMILAISAAAGKSLQSMKSDIRVKFYSPIIPTADANFLLIFFIAVFCITIGSLLSVPWERRWHGIPCIQCCLSKSYKCSHKDGDELLDRNSSRDARENIKEQISKMTLIFVVIILIALCSTLLLLYFFYNYFVWFIIVIYCGFCVYGCYDLFHPFLSYVHFGDTRYSWVIQDLLSCAFCIVILKYYALPNLKFCTFLLTLLFLYDIFFVFITPLITKNGESIMVQVAVGGGRTSSQARNWTTSTVREELPLLIKVPRFYHSAYIDTCFDPMYSLLGFGDILVPGMFIAFCHRFDVQKPYDSIKVYFLVSLIGYVIGLIATFVGLILSGRGQPALLYIVPLTLIPTSIAAWRRSELKQMWKGKFENRVRSASIEDSEQDDAEQDEMERDVDSNNDREPGVLSSMV
ncbi:Signal peptide peptidase-like 2B [Trichoplax sp. H2]|nr:Signal peptide peptidase-like 2B [Trichoplax sp. H2]|eukprot:RDD37357.1 Signal peptide peptidase-like 2B [Trichoplax sp. H2]